MKKIKVAEATPIQLNWLVATCLNLGVYVPTYADTPWLAIHNATGVYRCPDFTADWLQGGKIIDCEGIDLHQIKRRPFELYEYTAQRAALPGAEVVARHSLRGPARWVRVPRKKGVNEGMWLARMSVDNHPFGWKPSDFMSPTALMAAMRCYVASKLGDEVEVPKELP